MLQEFKVALISNDPKTSHDLNNIIQKQFTRVTGKKLNLKIFASAPSVEDTIHYIPHLVVICIDPANKENGMTVVENLSRISDRVPLVVCCSDLDADLMLGCVKRGVRDFIHLPFDEDEINEMLQRLTREMPLTGEGTAQGETFTFFSYKGGLGTTFVACNVAVALARLTRARVLLWDLVIQNGDVPFFFDHDPTATLTDLIENAGRIDDVYLRATLPVLPYGISILAAPKRPEEGESIRNDQLQGLLQTLRKYYDFIIVDGGHSLTDQIIGAMDASKNIVLMTDLHLPVLKNTLRCLEVFERLGYTHEKFKLVLNRYNSKYQKFDLAKAEEILRYPITFTIANDYVTVSRSLNTGIPVAELDENSILAKQFQGMAKMMIHNFEEQEEGNKSLMQSVSGLFGGGAKKKEKKKAEAKPEKSVPAKDAPKGNSRAGDSPKEGEKTHAA